MTLHFLNDVANDGSKLTKKAIIMSLFDGLSSESACKRINRIPGSRLLISCLPGSALRTHVESQSLAW